MKSDLSIYYSTKLCTSCNPRNMEPSKVTIHHMAGTGSIDYYVNKCYDPKFQTSVNYIIDNDKIICVVPEEYRAWTSSSRWNDYRAITIEVRNSTGAPDWEISDASYKSLIKLCVDICKRYHINPYFDGTINATFTYHYMYAATECPGKWIKDHTKQIINDIKSGLKDEVIPESEPSPVPVPQPEPDKKNLVKVTVSALNIRSGPGTKFPIVGCITDHGIYTIVEKKSGWGHLKSGAGWIYLKYTKGV